MERANHHFGDPDRLRNSRMTMGGEKPPCPRCHAALQEFARQHGSQVDDHWPPDNPISYDGRTSGNPHAPVSPEDMLSAGRLQGSGTEGQRLIDGRPAGNFGPRGGARPAEDGSRQLQQGGVNPQAVEGSMDQQYHAVDHDNRPRPANYQDPNAAHGFA